MRIKTACNRDCPDACGIVATVEDGRITRIEGDPDHPVTRGFLCYRTNRFLERQYDPGRLTTPLMRTGGRHEPVSWDDALDAIATKLLRVREESGPAAIFNYRSGGSLGLMKHVTDHFFERFGPVTVKAGDICSGAGDVAQEEDFGEEDSHDLFDLLNSRTVVMWGKNPHVSNVHLLPVLKQARERGATLIQIDPVHHRGSTMADMCLQPRPGGDIALALGVARHLFDTGKTDPQAHRYCDHLDDFRAACDRHDVAGWAERADVPVEALVALAERYADGPSAILAGWGMQRREHGSATIRVLDALGAVSGNLGISGGGVSFYFKRRGAFDLSFSGGTDTAPRTILEPMLGPAVLAARDPEVRVMWVHLGNPVAMLPESGTVARALETREMTVVVDAFMTDSARRADVVLPTTTMLEDDDLVGAYGHHWISEVRPVVPPPAGVKTDYEIVQALAARVGLGDAFAEPARVWKERLLSRVAGRGCSLEDLANGPVRNPEAPRVLFEGRRFPTASGKVNLIRDPPVAPPRPTAERPLLLMALATRKAQASQWSGAMQQGPAQVVVHPDAAGDLVEGEIVRLESEIAAIEVVLRFDSSQRRDVALMDKGGWFDESRSANALIRAAATDAGGGARYYDTPVRLMKIES